MLAVVESSESSNRLEGVTAARARMEARAQAHRVGALSRAKDLEVEPPQLRVQLAEGAGGGGVRAEAGAGGGGLERGGAGRGGGGRCSNGNRWDPDVKQFGVAGAFWRACCPASTNTGQADAVPVGRRTGILARARRIAPRAANADSP